MPKSQRITVSRTCEVCGSQFDIAASRLLIRPARFCSKDCQFAGNRIPLKDRFLRFLGMPDENGCIPWTGSLSQDGYGHIGSGHGTRVLLAHRAAYELFVGPIPDDKLVLHSCDNPPCVNHEHLFLGDDSDNKIDCMSKGRHARGETSGAAKLTEAQVLEIRDRYVFGSGTIALANEFRISECHLRNIAKRRKWKHV